MNDLNKGYVYDRELDPILSEAIAAPHGRGLDFMVNRRLGDEAAQREDQLLESKKAYEKEIELLKNDLMKDRMSHETDLFNQRKSPQMKEFESHIDRGIPEDIAATLAFGTAEAQNMMNEADARGISLKELYQLHDQQALDLRKAGASRTSINNNFGKESDKLAAQRVDRSYNKFVVVRC